MKLLGGNRNMTIFTASYGLMFSIFVCISATINQMTAPYGYTVAETSVLGAASIVSGVLGSIAVGIALDRTRKYLTIYRTLCAGCLVTSLPFFWTLPSSNMYVLLPNIFLATLCAVPAIPLAVGFSVELAFPVHEATACGWVAFWSNIASFGFTYLAAWLAE